MILLIINVRLYGRNNIKLSVFLHFLQVQFLFGIIDIWIKLFCLGSDRKEDNI